MADSNCQFVGGCSTDANTCFIPTSVQNLPNCWLANWVPLSDTNRFDYPEATNYVLPHKVLDLVGRDLRHWLSLYPLREVLYGDHEVLHMSYHQRERSQYIDSPGMKRPGAVIRPELFWWRLVPVSVLLTLLALLCIPHAVFPYGWPIVCCTNGLQC